MRYEAEEVRKLIRANKTQSDDVSHNESLGIARIQDDMRKQLGVRFPEDDWAPTMSPTTTSNNNTNNYNYTNIFFFTWIDSIIFQCQIYYKHSFCYTFQKYLLLLLNFLFVLFCHHSFINFDCVCVCGCVVWIMCLMSKSVHQNDMRIHVLHALQWARAFAKLKLYMHCWVSQFHYDVFNLIYSVAAQSCPINLNRIHYFWCIKMNDGRSVVDCLWMWST